MKGALKYTWCEQKLKAYSFLTEFPPNFLKKITSTLSPCVCFFSFFRHNFFLLLRQNPQNYYS